MQSDSGRIDADRKFISVGVAIVLTIYIHVCIFLKRMVCTYHSVYQPGEPGNLRDVFKPGILMEISGNCKNSLEK